MVEALVNHNPAPKLTGQSNRSPLFDARYDWSEYSRAWTSISALVRHAKDAWPELVKHLDDERYCTTFETESGSTYNWSVSDVCRAIVGRSLSEAYYRNLTPESEIIYARLRSPDIARDKKKLKSWCEQRRDKNLYELQIDMCEWAKTELGKPDDFSGISQLRKRAWVSALDAEVESLRESEKAVSFPGFGREEFIPYSAEKAEKVRLRQSQRERD